MLNFTRRNIETLEKTIYILLLPSLSLGKNENRRIILNSTMFTHLTFAPTLTQKRKILDTECLVAKNSTSQKSQIFRICNARDNEYRRRKRIVHECPFIIYI